MQLVRRIVGQPQRWRPPPCRTEADATRWATRFSKAYRHWSTSSASTVSITRSATSPLSALSWPHTFGLLAKYRRSHTGTVTDISYAHDLTVEIAHRDFVAWLLFKKAVRLGVFCFCYTQLVTSQVILSARPIPTHFVRREVSPPIIRDRAGAIRPDFSVCVESSCTLVGRTSSVILGFLVHPRELGASPSAYWEDGSRQSQVVSSLFVGI